MIADEIVFQSSVRSQAIRIPIMVPTFVILLLMALVVVPIGLAIWSGILSERTSRHDRQRGFDVVQKDASRTED